jgi:regulator of protease activity HflC (stomatin/prohibitin superfamily)
MTVSRTEEIERRSTSGYLMVAVGLVLILAGAAMLLRPAGLPGLILDVLLILVGVFVLAGLYMLQPNEAAILLLFGQYVGTDRAEGLRWANPFYKKQKISLRAHNFVSDRLKVNDKRGNPIEIAAAIVWRVRNTAQAVFDVEDYQSYVTIQAEAAVRHLASSYAYDEGEEEHSTEPTLRGGKERITEALIAELTERFDQAGIIVEDAKLTHLASRAKIVHGAVSMVEMALKGLSERKIVELDDERRAAMVSNLLVVLCAETEAQPVINTGTLYQG